MSKDKKIYVILVASILSSIIAFYALQLYLLEKLPYSYIEKPITREKALEIADVVAAKVLKDVPKERYAIIVENSFAIYLLERLRYEGIFNQRFPVDVVSTWKVTYVVNGGESILQVFVGVRDGNVVGVSIYGPLAKEVSADTLSRLLSKGFEGWSWSVPEYMVSFSVTKKVTQDVMFVEAMYSLDVKCNNTAWFSDYVENENLRTTLGEVHDLTVFAVSLLTILYAVIKRGLRNIFGAVLAALFVALMLTVLYVVCYHDMLMTYMYEAIVKGYYPAFAQGFVGSLVSQIMLYTVATFAAYLLAHDLIGPPSWSSAVQAALVAFSLILWSSVIVTGIYIVEGVYMLNYFESDYVILVSKPYLPLVYTVTVAAMSGFFEELFYRGLLLKLSRNNIVVALLLTCALWSIGHSRYSMDPIYAKYIQVIAIAIPAMLLLWKNVLSLRDLMLMHATFNYISIVASYAFYVGDILSTLVLCAGYTLIVVMYYTLPTPSKPKEEKVVEERVEERPIEIYIEFPGEGATSS